jgi:peptidoglycan/LPS O-acetylase OafA/YrhL
MACYGLQDSSKPRLHFESTKQAFGVSFDDWTRRSALTIPAVVRRYQTLDGLRGIAALAVVMLHSNRWFLIAPNLSASAVDLFFLLSGFVVAAAYEHRLASGMSAARFMAIRIVRLYPLYLVGLLIALFGLDHLFVHTWGRHAVSPCLLESCAICGAYAAKSQFWCDGQSLSFEHARLVSDV